MEASNSTLILSWSFAVDWSLALPPPAVPTVTLPNEPVEIDEPLIFEPLRWNKSWEPTVVPALNWISLLAKVIVVSVSPRCSIVSGILSFSSLKVTSASTKSNSNLELVLTPSASPIFNPIDSSCDISPGVYPIKVFPAESWISAFFVIN